MFKLSRLADYAVVTMVELGRHVELVTAPALAQETGLPEPTVAKLLKVLLADGLLQSRRGARGGYELALPLKDISIARVIAAVDGPVMVTACVDGGDCGCTSGCSLKGKWDVVNDAIRATLEAISLADMTRGAPDGAGGLSAGVRRGPESAAPGAAVLGG
ncbi:SUF system Fe-S cluster assembly regulator [Acetobacter sp. AN02]|uniref:SUF system Fe-S cluster assembly regulator n=1 Tax=Acetobacter sp. AN02 TaxID=2894186 RepID=UPI0024344D51|nr:SUF system Fe-S cluster assembly regulator [Acetobacter sp. AN02]MDG6094855.1 SUF system Fe-S cluster assembly regulator [Acetobacter sp. AN02]